MIRIQYANDIRRYTQLQYANQYAYIRMYTQYHYSIRTNTHIYANDIRIDTQEIRK
jgi:hypothetical protein